MAIFASSLLTNLLLLSPDKLPEVSISEVSTCAMDAKMKCIDGINGALGKIDKSEPLCKDYEQKITLHDERVSSGDPAVLDKLDDVVADALAVPNEASSESSASQDSETKAKHQELRKNSQARLFDHVEKAMKLAKNEILELVESESTESKPEGSSAPLSPSSNLSTKLSSEQRTVLENFSTQLKKEGVEVLKLGRRNRWQVRYLTVSREVTSFESDDDVGQCPKALLWPKQRNPPNCSVASIKDNGRGGVRFDHLKQVRAVESNEYYDRHVPRKLKETFPTFAGIVLDYWYEGGERQLHFCFKSKLEAQAFSAAVTIIKEATNRGNGKADEKIESSASQKGYI